jgi:hypothetical protein
MRGDPLGESEVRGNVRVDETKWKITVNERDEE